MPQIQIPATLRPQVNGLAIIEVDGYSVGELLKQLILLYPKLETSLFSHSGELHGYVNLFIDSQSIRDLQNLDTPIAPHQTLLILPALSGG